MDDVLILHSSSTGDDAGGEGAGVEAGVDPSISDVSSAPPPSGGIVLEMSQDKQRHWRDATRTCQISQTLANQPTV